MRESACPGTNLGGTVVVAVVAVVGVVAVLVTVHGLFVVDFCCCWWCWWRCWYALVCVGVGFLLLLVGGADVLMCCDADALLCGGGLFVIFSSNQNLKNTHDLLFNMARICREESAITQFPRIL